MNDGPCDHCGLTSHGFVCCGLLFADEPGGCPANHGAVRAPVKGQSGPPKPLRTPRRVDPRRSR